MIHSVAFKKVHRCVYESVGGLKRSNYSQKKNGLFRCEFVGKIDIHKQRSLKSRILSYFKALTECRKCVSCRFRKPINHRFHGKKVLHYSSLKVLARRVDHKKIL